jgi:DHA1 family multidrug resistance protein-like MFS transporter
VSEDDGSQANRVGSAERRRALIVILISTFFAWGGFFMVVPLLSIHYVDDLGWAAAAIGVVLAVRQFTQQGLAIFTGILADRIGAKAPILFGMGLRAFGFAAMGFADSFGFLMTAAVVSAVGGAFFESPRAAAVAALTTEAERPRYYSLVGVMGGLGTAGGMQLGVFLLQADFKLVSLAAGVAYVIITIVLWIFLPPVQVSQAGSGLLTGVGLAVRDTPFVQYTGLMIGHFFLSAQFFIALPLLAVSILGGIEGLVFVYAINSVVSVALAYPLPRLLARFLSPASALIFGNMVTTLGLLIMGLGIFFGPMILYAGVVAFSSGLVIVRPNDQTVLAGLANPVALGSYFGVAMLSLGIGGGLGNAASGWLYDLGISLQQPMLPWVVCTVIGVLTSVGLWWTISAGGERTRRLRQPEMQVP